MKQNGGYFIHQFIGWLYLVGGLEHFLFSHILCIIIPMDYYFSEGWPNHQPDMFGIITHHSIHRESPWLVKHIEIFMIWPLRVMVFEPRCAATPGTMSIEHPHGPVDDWRFLTSESVDVKHNGFHFLEALFWTQRTVVSPQHFFGLDPAHHHLRYGFWLRFEGHFPASGCPGADPLVTSTNHLPYAHLEGQFLLVVRSSMWPGCPVEQDGITSPIWGFPIVMGVPQIDGL